MANCSVSAADRPRALAEFPGAAHTWPNRGEPTRHAALSAEPPSASPWQAVALACASQCGDAGGRRNPRLDRAPGMPGTGGMPPPAGPGGRRPGDPVPFSQHALRLMQIKARARHARIMPVPRVSAACGNKELPPGHNNYPTSIQKRRHLVGASCIRHRAPLRGTRPTSAGRPCARGAPRGHSRRPNARSATRPRRPAVRTIESPT